MSWHPTSAATDLHIEPMGLRLPQVMLHPHNPLASGFSGWHRPCPMMPCASSRSMAARAQTNRQCPDTDLLQPELVSGVQAEPVGPHLGWPVGKHGGQERERRQGGHRLQHLLGTTGVSAVCKKAVCQPLHGSRTGSVNWGMICRCRDRGSPVMLPEMCTISTRAANFTVDVRAAVEPRSDVHRPEMPAYELR